MDGLVLRSLEHLHQFLTLHDLDLFQEQAADFYQLLTFKQQVNYRVQME